MKTAETPKQEPIRDAKTLIERYGAAACSKRVAEKSTRETIHDALVDCYNAYQRPVTRGQISELTGIKNSTIDEHMDKLINEDQTAIRMDRGLFEPVIRFAETRAISKTLMPSGMVKLDIADVCLDLTPAEHRLMYGFFGGGNPYAEAEAMQANRVLIAQQQVSIHGMNRKIAALTEQVRDLAGNSPQILLALEVTT